IRIAELAYTGTPFGTTEKQLLSDSVDLVITAPGNLATLDALAPDTPGLIYSNVSNLYRELLTDWLAYADANGLSRELAFSPARQATSFSGDSPASQPVTWFWGVYRDGTSWTNYTSQARGTTTGGVSFGGVGTSVYMGYTDRFREINLALKSAAASGWKGVVE